MGATVTHEMKSCAYIFPQIAASVPQRMCLPSSEYTQPILNLVLICTAIRSYFAQKSHGRVLPLQPDQIFLEKSVHYVQTSSNSLTIGRRLAPVYLASFMAWK